MRPLESIRKDIDVADNSLKELYIKRLSYAREVAESKKESGKPIFDKKREDEKIQAITGDIEDNILKNNLSKFFKSLMTDSKKEQLRLIKDSKEYNFGFSKVDSFSTSMKRIVYQGEVGAYSMLAAKSFFGEDKEFFNTHTFREAIEKVQNQEADCCVLPIENSTAGSVNEIYDLLVEYDLSIVAQQVISIRHALLGTKGTVLKNINKVYSHPQALAQCSRFFDENPGISPVEMLNTAAAAKEVSVKKDTSIAAIAGITNASIYNLEVIEDSIQNEDNNETRFIILSKDKCYTSDADKISITFSLLHEKGSLYNSLSVLNDYDINLSLIESRPIKNVNWEYNFFIDLEGNLSEKRVQWALSTLSDITNGFKVLGNY